MANPVFDWLMPFLTDLNKNRTALLIVAIAVFSVLWKGGRTGRVTVGVLVVTVIISDQLNSTFLKELFSRIRPCRTLEGVRLLVDCGGGLSFPSSHAVNNFAAAAVISHFYQDQKWYWFAFAALVALSRTYVGVHYPSDILAGSVVGFAIGYLMTNLWEKRTLIYKNKHTGH